MKLLDLVPKKETLEALQGVEARLLRRRQSSFIGLLLAVIGATVQTVSILASNTSLLDTLNKLLNALLTHPRSIPEMLFSREALGILFLLLGLGIYFTLRRTGLFMKEANEPFRYTFSIDKFKTIEGTSTADGFCLNDLGRLNLLQYDVRERLDTRIKRFSLLPTAGKEGGAQRYRSHIHITADVAVREDKGKWVIHVMPQVRIGPEGSAATLAAPVKYPVCVAVQGLRSHQLSAQEYDQLVERVYSSISTEIYRQLESDVKEKIRLFPSDYMRAVALCVEAEDFSRSNTVDAYDRAVGIFEDALRYFAVAEVRPASRLLLRISLLWRAEVRFQHRHARARVGYARCLVYRRILSSFSGRVRNPIFRARVELQRAIEALNDLEPWFTGKSPDSRLRSFLNFLSFPTDSCVAPAITSGKPSGSSASTPVRSMPCAIRPSGRSDSPERVSILPDRWTRLSAASAPAICWRRPRSRGTSARRSCCCAARSSSPPKGRSRSTCWPTTRRCASGGAKS